MAQRADTTKVRAYRPGDDDRASMACVEVVRGARRGQIVPLEAGENLIGRGGDPEVALGDEGISRRHARISLQSDGLALLVDLGSTNGTFVNGARVTRLALREGDRIDLGPEASLRFGYYRPEDVYAAGLAAAPAEPLPLSPREKDIARLVAEGATNAEIGKRLFISPRTVGTHLANIYERLDIHNRAELTRLVMERKLG